MLKIFRTKNPYILILIPVLTGILLYFRPESAQYIPPQAGQSFLADNIFSADLSENYSIWVFILKLLLLNALIFFSGYIINSKNFMLKSNFLYPFVVLVFLAIPPVYPEIIRALSSALLTAGAIYFLLKASEEDRAPYHYFNASLLIAAAGLLNQIYFSYILLIPAALMVFRQGSYKEFMAALIGFLLPFWLLYGIYYFVNGNIDIQPAVFSVPKALSFEFFRLERSGLLILIFPTVFGLFSLLFVTGRLRQLNTNHRLSFLLLIICFLISIIQIVLYPEEWYRLYPLLSFLIAVPVSFYLNNTRRKIIREIAFDLLLLFVAVNHLLFYFDYLLK